MNRNIGLFKNDKTFPLYGEQETLCCDKIGNAMFVNYWQRTIKIR